MTEPEPKEGLPKAPWDWAGGWHTPRDEHRIGIHLHQAQCLAHLLSHYETLIVYVGYSLWRKLIFSSSRDVVATSKLPCLLTPSQKSLGPLRTPDSDNLGMDDPIEAEVKRVSFARGVMGKVFLPREEPSETAWESFVSGATGSSNLDALSSLRYAKPSLALLSDIKYLFRDAGRQNSVPLCKLLLSLASPTGIEKLQHVSFGWSNRSILWDTPVTSGGLPLLTFLSQEFGNPPTEQLSALVDIAAGSGNMDAMKWLCTTCGATLAPYQKCWLMAAAGGHVEIAKFLVGQEKGPDCVGVKNYSNETALHIAIDGGHLEMARILIDAGSDVLAPGWSARTPLHQAAFAGEKGVPMVKLLLGEGPLQTPKACDALDDDSETPLQVAVRSAAISTVTLLLEVGANPHVQTQETGSHLLHLAANSVGPSANRKELATLLLDRGGVNVNAVDYYGRTVRSILEAKKQEEDDELIDLLKIHEGKLDTVD